MKLRVIALALMLTLSASAQVRVKGRKKPPPATPPTAPSSLVATPVSNVVQVGVTWVDNATTESGYSLERCTGTTAACTASLVFTQIAELPQNSTSYNNTNLASATVYSYRVRAFNTAGNSAYTSIDDATTTTLTGVIFQDSFESGDFSAWSPGTDHGGCPAVSGPDNFINSDLAFVHAGTKSYGSHYFIDGSCNFESSDQDLSVNELLAGNGYDNFYVRGYVYFKSPVGSKDAQRKIYYLFARDPITFVRKWSAILSTFYDATLDRMTLLLVVQNQDVGGSGLTFWLPSSTNLAFDTWYSIEFQVKSNTTATSNDGELRLFINGVSVYWTTGQNVRLANTLGINLVLVGQQVNRYNGTAIDEFRYWDQVVMSGTYIGP